LNSHIGNVDGKHSHDGAQHVADDVAKFRKARCNITSFFLSICIRYALWLALPGQGRYILSLVPHDGFRKAGTIRDSVVQFQDEGKEYEIRFMTPIAGAGKAWNLYMMHDPTYVPKESVRQSISMGTDRLDQLIPKP
jgi:hypothetical protein